MKLDAKQRRQLSQAATALGGLLSSLGVVVEDEDGFLYFLTRSPDGHPHDLAEAKPTGHLLWDADQKWRREHAGLVALIEAYARLLTLANGHPVRDNAA